MQRFVFLFLAASVVLLATVVPVEAAFLGKRETNSQRFARGLPPLPPVRRSPTESAMRRQVSPPPVSSTTGRLEVRQADGGAVLGYVANDPSRGPVGLNLNTDLNPAYTDLDVTFSGSDLLSQDPAFETPYYIGGLGKNALSPQNTNTIKFINVHAGPYAAIWSLDTTSGALNATWTNPDGTEVKPTLIYDAGSNVLSFTANPLALYNLQLQIPVTISLVKDTSP
ncbi:hypothetical protein EDB92DRAFT_1947404 [Lactarius akahatsu]|uniref:Uncharacterized protein n=1 Tax=Lactarius akahatsu TaxID=416441 RepID=A0AAD4QCN1_9AGAM|nr:hypothetical protein EDB92DRAFT_1947404 [Lactarius akahatsu]